MLLFYSREHEGIPAQEKQKGEIVIIAPSFVACFSEYIISSWQECEDLEYCIFLISNVHLTNISLAELSGSHRRLCCLFSMCEPRHNVY